ncbi:MAG: thioredoxin family protein [Verrucomicrobia bacterium]|nr:thioredoxin family protein [Verrucomicrobiota bacterium]
MKKSSPLLHAGLLALVTLATAAAGGEGWTSDFEAAKKQALAEKKDLLLDFTGSDWCGWCIKLNKEVFQEAAFKTGVKDTLVLVELDFPKDSSKLTADTKAQNEKLRDQFKINGYPSLLLCDAGGKAYAKTGYQAGGPEKYVQHLTELMAVRTKRDAAFAAADNTTDNVEKAKNLVAGLKVMDAEIVDIHYAEVVAKIGELDKDDATGFVKERKEAAAKEAAAADVGSKVQAFIQEKVAPLMQAKDFDKAYTEVQDYLKATPTLPDDMKVGLTLNIGLARFVSKSDQEGADKFVDEVIAQFPKHEVAKHGDEIKGQVKRQIEQAKNAPKDSDGVPAADGESAEPKPE